MPAPPFRLTPKLLLWLVLPPLLWAGNAVVGRALIDSVPPALLNALRWGGALLVLLPLSHGLWAQRAVWMGAWRWWLATGVLGMATYNTLLYQALHTSSPVNVTLIAASLPLAMLLVGALFFAVKPTRWQGLGALLSMAGVLVVVGQGSWQRLAGVQWVQGDVLMLLATLAWAGYSWLLTRKPAGLGPNWHWANTLALQITFGLLLAVPAAGLEQTYTATPVLPSAGVAWALIYIVLGPGLLAYRCWGLGVAQVGPAMAGFFANLTPVFAALMSAAWLGEGPQAFHLAAFLLIATGISVSARPAPTAKP